MAKLLVLNGASSAGKTTLAKALQSSLPDTYLYCSLDAFWNMTPPTIPASSENFPHLKQAMARSVKALVETGHNVIVDIIFRDSEDYAVFREEFAGVHSVVIKVECSLEELKRREYQRGDRKIGLAETQFHTAHRHITYDFEVNTAEHDPDACVNQVLAFLQAEADEKEHLRA